MEDNSSLHQGKLVGSKFKLEEQIGRGSFGTIWKCINKDTQEIQAIKFEKRQQKQSSMLVREIKVMIEMKDETGFSRLISYGKDEEYNYVVMSYMGRNMDSILKKCNGRFTTQTLCNVAQQMITRLEQLHSKNLIHRDIKPDNYVIGHGSDFNTVHLLDFGLAKYFRDQKGEHIPFVKKRGMIGTARYASVNAHIGHEQSRRDDLEGLGYVLLYFARGKLPWQSIYAQSKEEKYEKIKLHKQNTPIEQICENAPSEFVLYFNYVRDLEFEDTPNYQYLKSLFQKILAEKNLQNSDFVDWQNLNEYKGRKKQKPSVSAGQLLESQKNQRKSDPVTNLKQNNSNNNNDSTNANNTQKKPPVPTEKKPNSNSNINNTPKSQSQQVIQSNSLQNSKKSVENNSNLNNNLQISQQRQNNTKKLSLQVKATKQRDSLGGTSNLLNNLQVPTQSSLVNAVGNSSVYSQTAQYSIQGEGGGLSWGSKINQYQSSLSEEVNNEATPNLEKKVNKKQMVSGINTIKTNIKRKSELLNQQQLQQLVIQEESKNDTDKKKELDNKLQGDNSSSGNEDDNGEIIEDAQHVPYGPSYIGENITTQEPTVNGNRKVIQILQIKHSYKNNEDDV